MLPALAICSSSLSVCVCVSQCFVCVYGTPWFVGPSWFVGPWWFMGPSPCQYFVCVCVYGTHGHHSASADFGEHVPVTIGAGNTMRARLVTRVGSLMRFTWRMAPGRSVLVGLFIS